MGRRESIFRKVGRSLSTFVNKIEPKTSYELGSRTSSELSIILCRAYQSIRVMGHLTGAYNPKGERTRGKVMLTQFPGLGLGSVFEKDNFLD
jgi:hypothetical protein